MRDIYVCVIFLRVKIYWLFFYWSQFFNVHFSYCEVFMCQVFHVTKKGSRIFFGIGGIYWDQVGNKLAIKCIPVLHLRITKYLPGVLCNFFLSGQQEHRKCMFFQVYLVN